MAAQAEKVRLEEPKLERHVAGSDDGDTVGWCYKIDAKRQIWVGELSRDAFLEEEKEVQEALGDDGGWFVVLYDENKPQWFQRTVLARPADEERGREIARLMAIALKNGAVTDL